MAQYPPKPGIRCSGPLHSYKSQIQAVTVSVSLATNSPTNSPIAFSINNSCKHKRYFARHGMLFLSLINGGVICNCANIHLWLIAYQHRPCVALCYSSKSYGHQNLVAIKISYGTWLRKVYETSRHADRFGGPEHRHSSFSMKFPQQLGIHTVANANKENTNV